jgi:hypothetical protein
MSVFEGIEHVSAEGTSNRQYFEPGRYLVTIESVFLHEKRLGGGKIFIVETTINESDNPNIKPGEQRNWVQSLSIPSALPRIKAFIGAAFGMCPKTQLKIINEKVTKEICSNAISAQNPLRGVRLSLQCTAKKTQAGKDFTQASWRVINGQER